MESKHTLPTKLYLGTTVSEATKVIAGGRQSRRHAREVGARVYATESIAVAYAHGPYDVDPAQGACCVVELRVNPRVRWLDLGQPHSIHGLFMQEPLDAVRTWGDLWAVWNTSGLISSARVLSHDEALRRLIREFETRGPDVIYEGITDEYAALWWRRAPHAGYVSPRVGAISQRLRVAAGFEHHPTASAGVSINA